MNLLGKAMDKSFWQEVREKECYKKFRDDLFDLWEKFCENGSIVAFKYSDFKLFWTTGNRGVYEKTYFARRRALGASALLSLVYPEEEKYLDRLMDQIYAICDEYTWCLPAHQGKLEVNDNGHVDLFASETAFALSEIYTLLGDRLEPLIQNRILMEVDRRVFRSYMAEEPYSWWERGTNNWTAVCTASVAGAFMYLRPDLAKGLIPRFERSMECYLADFRDDGVCNEGCRYWNYGFGFFAIYADMIKTFTNGEIDWWKRDKVRSIATFLQKMFLSGKAGVSFSDSEREISYPLGLCHYLKGVYPEDVVVYNPLYSHNLDECGRFSFLLRSATWLNVEYYNNPAPNNVSAEYYAADNQWFMKRTASYGFAAKGGHNAEHHSHNDVGIFIFAKNGRQVLMDLGAGIYSRQYFRAERYSILECSSRGHSVPIVDGALQYSDIAATSVGTKFENGVFSTDIAAAYQCDGLESIKRSFAFTEETVTLTDVFAYTGTGEIIDRIVTLYEPRIEGGKVVVEDVIITYDPALCDATINSEIRQNGETCYFIDFKLKPGIRTFTCEIK